MTDIVERLLPCPFCGGAPEIDTLRAYRNISTGRLGDGVAIYCTECNADMMMCRADHPGMETEDMISIMRDAWNRRHVTPAALEAARRILSGKDENGRQNVDYGPSAEAVARELLRIGGSP